MHTSLVADGDCHCEPGSPRFLPRNRSSSKQFTGSTPSIRPRHPPRPFPSTRTESSSTSPSTLNNNNNHLLFSFFFFFPLFHHLNRCTVNNYLSYLTKYAGVAVLSHLDSQPVQPTTTTKKKTKKKTQPPPPTCLSTSRPPPASTPRAARTRTPLPPARGPSRSATAPPRLRPLAAGPRRRR